MRHVISDFKVRARALEAEFGSPEFKMGSIQRFLMPVVFSMATSDAERRLIVKAGAIQGLQVVTTRIAMMATRRCPLQMLAIF
jgi:hypothetical protein